MKFNLSLGLFSSNDIDSGTKLLLKTIAQQTDLEKVGSILDMGCGVGVIGISLKKACPEAAVRMRDRDALAVAFSRDNSRINQTENLIIENKLGLEELDGQKFDLLLSNLPAKAGETVLEDFFRRSVNFITDKGRVAVVIVAPLAAYAGETIEKLGHELLYKEENYHYSVFHFRGSAVEEKEDELSVYIRNSDVFQLKKTEYHLETVWNIPDFDKCGFHITHSAELLNSYQIRGNALFWNPGQGHVPVYLAIKKNNRLEKVYLSGRDLLQIRISERNLNRERPQVETIPLPLYTESLLKEFIPEASLDFASFDITPVSGTEWQKDLKETMKKLLKPGAWFFVIGKSADLHILLKENRGFTPVDDRKYKGVRAALFRRNS